MKSKLVAALLAFFLGGIGGHKFYLGQPGLGILYLFFCWTLIPGFIAFIEMIILLTMSDHAFNVRYNPHLFYAYNPNGYPQNPNTYQHPNTQHTNNQAQNVTINLGPEIQNAAQHNQQTAQPQLSQNNDIYTELEKLDELRQRGILSETEFTERKKIILRR